MKDLHVKRPFTLRDLLILTAYSGITAAAFYAAYELRFDFLVPPEQQMLRLHLLPFAVGAKLVALVLARQLGILVTFFSLPDLLRVGWAMVGASAVLMLPRLVDLPAFSIPRGVLLIDLILSLLGICTVRIGARLFRERMLGARRAPLGRDEQRIAIIGAGDAGASLAKEFINSPHRGFRPVMFFDDDAAKHGRLIHGIPVVGRPEAIAEVKGAATLVKVVIAMPSAPSRRVREIVAALSKLGIKVETMPSLEELASGRVKSSRIRPVEVEDLLGRETVNLDLAAMRHRIAGRRILVTGAGGSIGSELCRQIGGLQPARLLMVEQAEGALFLIEQELNERGLGALIVPLVADVLDRERLEFIFERYRPDVVFHAAAHKHVYMMERQPSEALRNNVLGTRRLAQVAAASGVEAFIFISTDKAINPTSVMGATKRLAELQLMAFAAAANSANPGSHRTKFMAVRFGNVLGSSGSVIPIFKRQIANGGPVTVTHPDVTRYFMTIPEAVGLVLQSFVLGQGGEIFVLDMGQPVKIVDLARQMIELSGLRVGEDIEISYTGLKPGEKFFEELKHDSEDYAATDHPRIMRFTGRAVLPEAAVRELEQELHALDSNALKALIKRYVPEYTPFLD